MIDFFCDICDGNIKLKYEKKHSTTRLHIVLSMSVVNRYCVKNPTFLQIEDIIKKHVFDYNKRFGFFIIICEWKLDFDNIICVVSERKYNIHNFWDVRRYFISKTDNSERQGYIFSLICVMKITFLTDRRNVTFKHYLDQPKCMIDWRLYEELSRHSQLIKTLRDMSHPLIRKYKYTIPPEEYQDLI